MPEWLDASDGIYFHQMLINEHGGLHGIRNEGALESTLARPIHLLKYEPETAIHELAASCGFGLLKNHVFNDGNKRISLAVIDIFLRINGMQLDAEEVDAVCVIKDVASDAMNEADLANWIEVNSIPFDLGAK